MSVKQGGTLAGVYVDGQGFFTTSNPNDNPVKHESEHTQSQCTHWEGEVDLFDINSIKFVWTT